MPQDGPIYPKFSVERTDGKSAPGEKHDGCDYFVLDVTHDPFAAKALDAYAAACEDEYPHLAESIRESWIRPHYRKLGAPASGAERGEG